MNTLWIVSHDGTDGKGFRIECQRCGTVYIVTLPVEVTVFVAGGKAFIKNHRHCKTKAEARP